MDKEFLTYRKAIKRKYSFGWIPKYAESFTVNIPQKVFTELAFRVCKKIDFEPIYNSDISVSAREIRVFGEATEELFISCDSIGIVEVRSESTGNHFVDLGRNSKHVKLFIYAMQQELQKVDEAQVKAIEEKIRIEENMEDYVIPESLPKPKKYREPNYVFPLVAGLLSTLLLSFIYASLRISDNHLPLLSETFAGILLGFGISIGLRFGNFVDGAIAKRIVTLCAVVFVLLNIVFQYNLILYKLNIEEVDFLRYMQLKMDSTIKILHFKLGPFWMISSWILFMVLLHYIAYIIVLSSIIKIETSRVPPEVLEFAVFYLIRGKSKREVGNELSKMGWKKELEQRMVFEVLDDVDEINTMPST